MSACCSGIVDCEAIAGAWSVPSPAVTAASELLRLAAGLVLWCEEACSGETSEQLGLMLGLVARDRLL